MYVVKKTRLRVKCGSQALVVIAAATRRAPATNSRKSVYAVGGASRRGLVGVG